MTKTAELAQAFSSLSGETRIRLLQVLHDKILHCRDPKGCDLSQRCCNVTEVARRLGVTVPTVSYHLRELRRTDLITMQRRGRYVYCLLNARPLRQLAQFFETLSQMPDGGGERR